VSRNGIISGFFLCLLLVVNWHNTFVHSHAGNKDDKHLVALHGHEHSHSDHHHDHHFSSLWNWISHVFGDFNHSDLGDNHMELFITSNHTTGLDFSVQNDFSSTVISWIHLYSRKAINKENSPKPVYIQSFSDPPFLDAVGNRGPPLFS
jgi:hypothetical protein